MIEIVDRLLQLLEDVLLALAIARDVGNGPQRLALPLAARNRPDAQAIPGDTARARAHRLGEPDLLHRPAPLARRLREAVDRLRHFRRAREEPLDGRDRPLASAPGIRRDRPRWRRRSVRLPADQKPIGRGIGDGLREVVGGGRQAEMHETERVGEQKEHASRRKNGEHHADEGGGLTMRDEQHAQEARRSSSPTITSIKPRPWLRLERWMVEGAVTPVIVCVP